MSPPGPCAGFEFPVPTRHSVTTRILAIAGLADAGLTMF